MTFCTRSDLHPHIPFTMFRVLPVNLVDQACSRVSRLL